MADSSNDETLKARIRADRFYEELDRLVRRYPPRDYGPRVASILFSIADDIEKWARYPPHHLIHSIEANCAYHRASRDEQLTEQRFNQILNHYKDYYDPYLKHILEEGASLHLFALAMSRQQFFHQKRPRTTDLARSLLMFPMSDKLSQTSSSFESAYGLDFADWILMCFCVWTYCTTRTSPLTSPANYLNAKVDFIPKNAVGPFLDLSSLTVDQIAKKYREVRTQYPSYLHIFIPSVFLDHPLIQYEDGNYLAVHPSLLFHFSLQGLFNVCEGLEGDHFRQEFAQSFEGYVGDLLSEFEDSTLKLREAEIEAYTSGKVCDYLLVFEDSVILVECKSTKYSATLVTENAVAGDNSTAKISDAFEQLHSVASDVRQGHFEDLFSVQNRPIYGLVVTLGDMHFVNSEWYSDKFILPRLRSEIARSWPEPMTRAPQVMSVSTLEDFVILANASHLSSMRLIEQKLEQEFLSIGDWPQYISSLTEPTADWELPLFRNALDDFYGNMGIPEDGIQMSGDA